MSVQMRSNEDHEVVGSDYCSGYTDNYGKWNTGFFCPKLVATDKLYCCGSSSYKYCCTKKDETQQEIPHLMLILGLAVGVIVIIVVITLASCFFCSCCALYKRRHTTTTNGGSLYQMHCSSTGSGVANMYSFSNQNSSVTTPVETSDPHPLTELEYQQALHINISSPRLPHSFSTDTPRLSRADVEECSAVAETPCIELGEQRPGSLSPCMCSSSTSMSIPIRDIHYPAGLTVDPHVSYSPPLSNEQHSSFAGSPLPTSHSSSISGQANVSSSPAPHFDESLYHSTKF